MTKREPTFSDVILVIAASPFLVAFRSWILAGGWNHIISPILHAPLLNTAQMGGVYVFIGALRHTPPSPDSLKHQSALENICQHFLTSWLFAATFAIVECFL
jgi:hypothetical protein